MTKMIEPIPPLFIPSGCLTSASLQNMASGRITGKDLASIKEHLAGCEICRDALEGMQAWLRMDANADLSSKVTGISERLNRQLDKEKRPHLPTKLRQIPSAYRWAGIAAAVLLFVGVAYLVKIRPSIQTQPLALEAVNPSNGNAAHELSPDQEKVKIPVESPPDQSVTKKATSKPVSNTIVSGQGNERVSLKKEAPVHYDNTLNAVSAPPSTAALEQPVADISADEEQADRIIYVAGGAASGYKVSGGRGNAGTTGMVTVEKNTSGKKGMQQQEPAAESNLIFATVEQMPYFPGGEKAMQKFLSDNLIYPQPAMENGIQGLVSLSFYVGKNGIISKVNVLRGIGAGCDEEAMRVVRKMPVWIPGKQAGKEVDVLFNLPLEFRIKK